MVHLNLSDSWTGGDIPDTRGKYCIKRKQATFRSPKTLWDIDFYFPDLSIPVPLQTKILYGSFVLNLEDRRTVWTTETYFGSYIEALEMKDVCQFVFDWTIRTAYFLYVVSFFRGSVVVSITKMSSASAPDFPENLEPLVSIFFAFDSCGSNLITVFTICGTFEVGKMTW